MSRRYISLAFAGLLGLGLTACSDSVKPATSSTRTAAAASSASTAAATSGPGGAALLAAAGPGTLAVASAKTSDGYDGATVDKSSVTVWHSADAKSWTKAGSSPHPPTTSSDRVGVEAALPAGASSVVFIVTGPFSADGADNALVIGKESGKWGALAATDERLALSGTNATSSFLGARVTGGRLETSSVWGKSTAPITLQTAHPLVTTWKPQGGSYVVERTNAVTATTAPAIQPPQKSTVPADHEGTFVVRINELRADGKLVLQGVKAVTCMDTEAFGCFDPVGSPFVAGFADDAKTTFVSAESMTNVTAPTWLWAQINGKRTVVLEPSMFTTGGPYVIPKGLVGSVDGVDTAMVTLRGGKILRADSIFHP